MKILITFILVCIAELAIIVGVTSRYVKVLKEKKKFETLYNNTKDAMSKIEENIENANKEKEKLNTGDSVTNINNAADIMHKYTQKRKSKD